MSGFYRRDALVGLALCLVSVGLVRPSASAADENGVEVAPDTCILELRLPKGATVTVDGRDYGAKHRLAFRGLRLEQVYAAKVVARFRDGGGAERKVLIQGGRRIVLPLLRADASRPELVLQAGHSGTPGEVDMSPDGRYVLTADSSENVAILWEVATGRQLRTYAGHTEGLVGVAFAAAGSRVATASYDDTVVIWDRDTGRELQRIRPETCYCLAVSPDGRTVVVGEHEKRATLWDTITGQKLQSFEGEHKGTVFSAAFSSDGRRVVTGSWDKKAVVWDAATGRPLHTFSNHRKKVQAVALSPDGRRLLVGTGESDSTEKEASGELVLWDTAEEVEAARVDLDTACSAVAFTPDGRHIAAYSYGYDEERNSTREYVVYRAENLDRVRGLYDEESSWGCLFSPDGRLLFDGRILWDWQTGEKRHTFGSRQDRVIDLRITPDGGRLLVELNKKVALLDLGTGSELREFPTSVEKERFMKMDLSPDGRRLTCVLKNDATALRSLVGFDVSTGEQVFRFPVASSLVYDLALSADYGRVLTRSDERAFLWELPSGRLLRTFGSEDHEIHKIALSPDGRRILTNADSLFDKSDSSDGSRHQLAFLWDADSGRLLHKFKYSRFISGSSVSFTPDGGKIVIVGDDNNNDTGIVIFWDARTFGELAALQGHTDKMNFITFTPDGRYAVSYCHDAKTSIVWDVREKRKLGLFRTHNTYKSPSLSPDGRFLLTLPGDGSIRLHDVATGDQILRLIHLSEDRGWMAMTPEGLFDGQAEGRQLTGFRVGGRLNVVPVDRFFQDFYYPGLLSAIWRGERPMPEVEMGRREPPEVRIVSATEDATVERSLVTVEVEAVDRGGGVNGPWLFQNGARVLVPGRTERVGDTVRRRFEIALVEGENRLEFRAACADGSWESEPVSVVLRYGTPLDKSDLYLVAVGVNRYADANLNLNYAASDATAMAALFRDRGDTLYARVHTTELLDQDATKARITEALKEAASQTRPQDTLMVFLAGHGTMVGQRYYFVPYELRKQAERLEDDVRKQGLPADEISDYLGSARALKRMLVFDTCASGGALGRALKGRSGFALRGAIERLSRSQGVFTIAASSATEEAQESEALGHGVLSYALLAGLKAVEGGPLEGRHVQPSSPERVVDVMEWFTFASGQVPRLTEKLYGASQDVQTSTQGASFPVLPLEK